jgi:hypothetical protein
MFYDVSLGAFRAGNVSGTEWDVSNRGFYSIALGQNTIASGNFSFAAGGGAQAWGESGIAIGEFAYTGGADDAVAIGTAIRSTGTNTMAFGVGSALGAAPEVSGTSSVGFFIGDQSGYNMNYTSSFGIFGGDLTLDSDTSSAASRGCIRFNDTSDQLEFSHDCSAYQAMGTSTASDEFTELTDTPANYASQSGRFVRVNAGETGFLNDLDNVNATPNDQQVLSFNSASQTWVAADVQNVFVPPGLDREIIFNSGGQFATSTNFVFTSTGRLGVGLNNPGQALDIQGNIQMDGVMIDRSDLRLKTDIKSLREGSETVIGRLSQIGGYSFRMKADDKGQIEYGVIAQEVERVFPELVITSDDKMGTKNVNYLGLIAPMIEATKELSEENAQLKADLESRDERFIPLIKRQ